MKEKVRKRKIIIWPIYFDSRFSRKEGRRVPLYIAIEHPSLELISKAAKTRGLQPIIDINAKHPKTWFDSQGRLIIYTNLEKSKIIRLIGTELSRISKNKKKK